MERSRRADRFFAFLSRDKHRSPPAFSRYYSRKLMMSFFALRNEDGKADDGGDRDDDGDDDGDDEGVRSVRSGNSITGCVSLGRHTE